MFEANLVALYSYVCERYEAELKYDCQRFSNNNKPVFTDQEAITVYLYVVGYERRFEVKAIHDFAKRYLGSWFPRLPSYQAFNNRINRLCTVFQKLGAYVLEHLPPPDHSDANQLLVDSLPVMTCAARRKGKVATEITSKGFCSTKGIYYYGLKLHLSGIRVAGRMPLPKYLTLSAAAENDLKVFKEQQSQYPPNTQWWADKAYCDQPYSNYLYRTKGSVMHTPVKIKKGTPLRILQYNKAADDLYSRAVSAIRQPIESLFNWIIEKTAIQSASKVRSTKGLLTHVFGKLAAAFYTKYLNP